MRARDGIVGLTLACLVAGPGHCTSLTDYPPALQQAMNCMVAVLKTVPGVTAPEAGVLEVNQQVGGTAPVPYIRYIWEQAQQTRGFPRFRPTVFYAAEGDFSDPAKFHFMVTLPGLFNAREEDGPDDWGTIKMDKRWKDRCGVNSNGLFV